MVTELVLASIVGLAALSTILLAMVLRRNRRSRSARQRHLDERLAETHDPARTHLEKPPRVRTVGTSGPDDDPRLVPVVQVILGMTEPPGPDLTFEYVASVIEAVQPALREESIHRYDVEFSFGPDGLLVSRLCQRVAVPADLANRLTEEDEYRAFDLRRDVAAREADGDPAAESWGECRAVDGG